MSAAVRPLHISLRDGESVTIRHRPGTKDRFTIEEIWTKHPYRLSRYGGVGSQMFIEEAYSSLLASGKQPLILDLGANIGASALAFRKYYPEAMIVAVEPEPGNLDLLRLNTAGDSLTTCVHAAVASFDGTIRIADPGRSTDAYRTGEDAAGTELGEVTAVSVGTLLEQFDATPFLAKIDIEGAESELFAANTGWVDQFPAITIELHDWMLPGKASSANFLRCVGELRRDFINPAQTDVVFSLRNDG